MSKCIATKHFYSVQAHAQPHNHTGYIPSATCQLYHLISDPIRYCKTRLDQVKSDNNNGN